MLSEVNQLVAPILVEDFQYIFLKSNSIAGLHSHSNVESKYKDAFCYLSCSGNFRSRLNSLTDNSRQLQAFVCALRQMSIRFTHLDENLRLHHIRAICIQYEVELVKNFGAKSRKISSIWFCTSSNLP